VAPLVAPTTPAEHAEVGGATRMFRAGFQAEQKARQGVAQAGGGAGRRVPQWLFLGHLFNDVVLADANARAASGSSTKTSLVKRIMLAFGRGDLLIYSGLLAWSYFGNRDLEQEPLAGLERGSRRAKARAARCRESTRCRSSKRCANRWRS